MFLDWFLRHVFGISPAAPGNLEALTPDPSSDGPEDEEASLEAVDLQGPIAIPIEDSLDLHTFLPSETRSATEAWLFEAQAQGFREVRIIHGRGQGVQRRIVQRLLARHPAVERFEDAPPARGGLGATLAWLKPAPRASDSFPPEGMES